jgi:hypothetical protein
MAIKRQTHFLMTTLRLFLKENKHAYSVYMAAPETMGTTSGVARQLPAMPSTGST